YGTCFGGALDPLDLKAPRGAESPTDAQRVTAAVLPHLDAAFNLARWLTGNDHDAGDVVQDAYLRAVRSARTFRGTDAKAWLLTIVRNACFDLLRRGRAHRHDELSDDLPLADDNSAGADP